MVALARILVCCLIVNAVSSDVYAQPRVTLNGRFDDGLFGWNNASLDASVSQRTYPIDYRIERPYDVTLTRAYAKIDGTSDGYFGQVQPLSGSSKQQVLNCHAYKRSRNGSGDGGFAVIAVSYYDSNWNELDRFEQPIDPIDETLSILGEGDGMNFYSYGLVPPQDSQWVFMFVYTTEGTDVLVDSFELVDYSIEESPPITSGLVLNPRFRLGNLGNDSVQSRNNEFWFNSRDPSKYERFGANVFGSSSQPEYAYQFLPLNEETVYVLETSGSGTIDTSASVGLDFYDADWRPIGKQIVNYRGESTVSEIRRITPPPTTAHTSLWIYADQSATDDTMTLFNAEVRPISPAATQATAAILTATGAFQPKFSPAVRFATIYLSDPQGVDLTTIRDASFAFASRAEPGEFLAAEISSLHATDADRLVRLQVSTVSDGFDAASLIIRGAESAAPILDREGNPIAAMNFEFTDD
ncbi:MAG: hypothetical protein ACE361_23860 [Aureliella sp.]